MISLNADGSAVIRALENKISNIQSAVIGAAKQAGVMIVNDVKSRIFLPRRINVQDAEAGTKPGRNPVRLDVDPQGVTVSVLPHWTRARSPVLLSVLSREGREAELEREGLWVDPHNASPTKKSRGGYTTRSGLIFKAFSTQPRLLQWARRLDRGMQVKRHAVYLDDILARKTLELQPALNRVLPIFKIEVEKGVRDA